MRFEKEIKLPAKFIEWDREAIRKLAVHVYHAVGHDFTESDPRGIAIGDFVADLLRSQLECSTEYHCIVPADYMMVTRDLFKENRFDEAKIMYSCPKRAKHRMHHCGDLIGEDTYQALLGTFTTTWNSQGTTMYVNRDWERAHRWALSVAYMAMKPYATRGRLQ